MSDNGLEGEVGEGSFLAFAFPIKVACALVRHDMLHDATGTFTRNTTPDHGQVGYL